MDHPGGHLVRAIPPRLMSPRHALEVPEPCRADVLARVLHDRLHLLPNQDVLTVRVEEELLVQEAPVHERRDHLPIRGGHAKMSVDFVAGTLLRADLLPALARELGKRARARAAQLGLAPQLS